MDRIPLCQIPREVIDEAGKAIFDYVIGFVALRKNKAGEEADLGGSGTLVQMMERGVFSLHITFSRTCHMPRKLGLLSRRGVTRCLTGSR